MTSEPKHEAHVFAGISGSAHQRLRTLICVAGALLVACSGARLDPEKNQALTFDTVGTSDAGVEPPTPLAMRRVTPSQLASDARGDTTPAPVNTASPTAEPIRCTQDPPDPKPVSTRDWVALQFAYVDGTAKPQSSHRLETARARDSARIMGRYAVELWIGCELIDRVRFSFPLQAAEAPPQAGKRRALHEPPSLTARAQLSTTVLVPFSQRATRAELVDRSAGTRVALAWPPALSPSAEKPAPATAVRGK